MTYKGYEIRILPGTERYLFNGTIRKGKVEYYIKKEIKKVEHTYHEVYNSVFKTSEQTKTYIEYKTNETYEELEKELKAIVDGMEMLLQEERKTIRDFGIRLKAHNIENMEWKQ